MSTKLNIPHIFTFTRLAIGPIFFVFYYWGISLGVSFIVLPYLLLTLVALGEVSDGIDGYLARRFNQVTDLGKILDPMADTVTHLTIFFAFTAGPIKIPLILVLILLYRELLLSGLRSICALQGIALAARPSGKLKAALQGTSIILILGLMLLHVHEIISLQNLQSYSVWILTPVAAYTALSTIDYFYAHRSAISNLMRNSK